MRYRRWFVACFVLAAAAGAWHWFRPAAVKAVAQSHARDDSAAPGKTQPAPGHSASLAPQVLEPVTKVLVTPGQAVKKDQPLIQLDDEEAQAEVAAKKAKLAEAHAALAQVRDKPHDNKIDEARAEVEKAAVATKHAKERTEKLKPLAESGAVAEKQYREARAKYQEAVQQERAARDRYDAELRKPWQKEILEKEAAARSAEAEQESAKIRLGDYTIKAPIAGVVSWLRVDPGTIARPGTATWGQILDLSEIDVCCDVSPRQARQLRVGQSATVTADGDNELRAQGKIVAIGVSVDGATRKLPVLVRLKNAAGRWPCNLPVRVEFGK